MKARVQSALASFVMLGSSILTAGMLVDMRDEARRDEICAAHNLLTAEADDIDRLLTVYDRSLRATALLLGDPGLAGASPRMQQLGLFDQTGDDAAFGPMRVIDADGHATHDASTLFPSAPTAAERDALERHRKDRSDALFFGKQLRRGRERDGDIVLSYRVEDANGHFAGIVTGTLRLAYMSGLLLRLHLGPHDTVGLFSTDGTILAHVPDMLGVGRVLVAPLTLRRLGNRSGGDFESRSILDGQRRLYSYVHVGHWPLVIDLGVSERDLYAPWRRRAWVDGVSLLVILATGLFLIVGLRQELLRRIGAEQKYRLLADHASDLILRLDQSLRLVYVSPSCRHYGREPDQMLGGSVFEGIHPDDVAAVQAALLRARAEKHDAEISYRIRDGAGRDVWVEGRYNFVARDGCFMAIIRDIDRRKEVETALERANADLERLASTDALTGLSNRRAFDEGLSLEWLRASRAGGSLSVMLIDVDHFKLFNDRYGHLEGDAVLRAVATAIRGCIRRPGDLAARYGGEEFVVILPKTDRFDAIGVAQSIRRAIAGLGMPHRDSVSGRITVSIGVAAAMPAEGGTDPAGLLAAADAALYDAKHGGRDQVRASPAAVALVQPDA